MADPKAEDKAPRTESKSNTGGDIDRVQMASRLPDGTPHQTPDFEFIGDQKSTEEAAKVQLGQQAVSAVDARVRSEQAAPEEDDGRLDANSEQLRNEQKSALKAAESRAASEVKAKTK